MNNVDTLINIIFRYNISRVFKHKYLCIKVYEQFYFHEVLIS